MILSLGSDLHKLGVRGANALISQCVFTGEFALGSAA